MEFGKEGGGGVRRGEPNNKNAVTPNMTKPRVPPLFVFCVCVCVCTHDFFGFSGFKK
jgi:hypothetical protein